MTSLVIFGLSIFSAIVCYTMSRARDGHAPFWALMGAFFGPFAIPFVIFSKPKSRSSND